MSLLGEIHGRQIQPRRIKALAAHLGSLLPEGSRVLDVGCGDGRLARAIADRRPDLSFEGIDVVDRPGAVIPVRVFDGKRIPCADRAGDVVLIADVLHHTDDPAALLAETCRVARRAVVVKDHLREGFLAGPTLRLMDWVGNAPYGTRLTYNYWTRDQWRAAFSRLGWAPDVWIDRLALYPPLADRIFGRSLHFIARLKPPRGGPSAGTAQ